MATQEKEQAAPEGMTHAMMGALSEAFPASLVKMKPGRRNNGVAPKGGYKYISHALVTERLNAVDPGWSWRSVTEHIYQEQGAPHCLAVTIEMTVGGATRVEVGGPQNRGALSDELKNAYSDAIKRAAMRFGVALGMWDELVDAEMDEDAHPDLGEQPQSRAAQPQQRQQEPPPEPQDDRRPAARGNLRAVGATRTTQNPGPPNRQRGTSAQSAAPDATRNNPDYPYDREWKSVQMDAINEVLAENDLATGNMGEAIKTVNAHLLKNYGVENAVVGSGAWNPARNEYQIYPSDIGNALYWFWRGKHESADQQGVAAMRRDRDPGPPVADDEDIPF